MRRREFIALAGASVAWPFAAMTQEAGRTYRLGDLHLSPRNGPHNAAVFDAVKADGFIAGQNLIVDDPGFGLRISALDDYASENRQGPCGSHSFRRRAAQRATKTIPIVFGIGEDPVKAGLVPDINRPPGNMTGVTFLSAGLGAKRLGMLRQLVPDADVIGLLANQNSPQGQQQMQDVADAAKSLRQQLTILNGSNDREIDAAFASLAERRVKALLVAADPSYDPRRNRLIALSAQYAIPTLYHFRDFPLAGGLACYGASISDLYRQVGIYVGRILHGEKPADLPVMLPTKFEFVINLKTARALKLDIPPTMLALADEVIE